MQCLFIYYLFILRKKHIPKFKTGRNLGFFGAASRWDPANSFVCHLGNIEYSQFIFNFLPIQEWILDFRA